MSPVWHRTFKLKDLRVKDKYDKAEVKATAEAIIQRLKVHQPFDEWTDDIIFEFVNARDTGEWYELSGALDSLYDRADEDRVWVE